MSVLFETNPSIPCESFYGNIPFYRGARLLEVGAVQKSEKL